MNDELWDESTHAEATTGIASSQQLEETGQAVGELQAEIRLIAIMLLRARARVEQHEAACLDIYERIEAMTGKEAGQPEAAAETRRTVAATYHLLAEQALSNDETRKLLRSTRSRLERSATTSNQMQAVLKCLYPTL
jgi:hypothetical protein